MARGAVRGAFGLGGLVATLSDESDLVAGIFHLHLRAVDLIVSFAGCQYVGHVAGMGNKFS